MMTNAVNMVNANPVVSARPAEALCFGTKNQAMFFGEHPATTFFKPVFPKLSISEPSDPLEQEADQVAEKVMQVPEKDKQISNP